MKDKNIKQPPQPSTRMVEDKATERRKKRDRDRGLVTIDANGKKAKESAAKKDEKK